MGTGTTLWLIACATATAALVWAESRHWRLGRAIFKLAASTAFVLLALQLGASDTHYGRLVLVALVLSWVGDALLLSARSRIFLFGIGAFLLAHVAFAAAFAQLPSSRIALAVGFLAMACVGGIVLRWLWPHLSPFYRVAVSAYVAAIVAMCSLAIAASPASGAWALAAGAIAFAASDISVARDRFVAPGFTNRAWGLPLYYAAQLVLACSVGSALAMV
ncbi:lysoplasmalogenase [Lysobacter niastensis]|uniref:Lysoplasmalogenase n=1 Tax=Lysobacter niastensis TaxID=380629 RepID=A0ABS0B9E5_9GAMM|nr:lysoplasmalogenase [Lysobacter niastensis]MBF6023730.1 lysoplasmalogenase [Lysobacter niastensis]